MIYYFTRVRKLIVLSYLLLYRSTEPMVKLFVLATNTFYISSEGKSPILTSVPYQLILTLNPVLNPLGAPVEEHKLDKKPDKICPKHLNRALASLNRQTSLTAK